MSWSLFFGSYALKILDKTYLPKPGICLICLVSCWQNTKSLYDNNKLTFLLLLHQTAIVPIYYQRAVLAVSNKLYFHHLHGGSKGLRLCIKLPTWLGRIYKMIQLLVYNCKAIRKDPVPNRIESRRGCFLTNGKKVWWQ